MKLPTLFIALAASGSAGAAEISVLSAGAVEPGLAPVVAAFENETGHKVKVTYNTAPQLRERIGREGGWDAVIAPTALNEELVKAGRLGAAASAVGKVGVGMAVREGASVPYIGDAPGLQRALLEADSVVFNKASTGLYLDGLLRKMGIADKVDAKSTRYADGASVMKHVAAGKGRELGFGAITEIRQFASLGLRYVGPLPADLQNHTTYVAALTAQPTQPAAAEAFVRYLASSPAKALLGAAGIE